MPSWLRLLKNSEKQHEPHIIIINTYQYQHQHHYHRHHHQHHHHYHRHHRHHHHHHQQQQHHQHQHQKHHVRLSSWGTRCQSFFSVLCLAHVWVFTKHSAKHFRDTKHHDANNCCNIPMFRQLSHNFLTTIWIIGWARSRGSPASRKSALSHLEPRSSRGPLQAAPRSHHTQVRKHNPNKSPHGIAASQRFDISENLWQSLSLWSYLESHLTLPVNAVWTPVKTLKTLSQNIECPYLFVTTSFQIGKWPAFSIHLPLSHGIKVKGGKIHFVRLRLTQRGCETPFLKMEGTLNKQLINTDQQILFYKTEGIETSSKIFQIKNLGLKMAWVLKLRLATLPPVKIK